MSNGRASKGGEIGKNGEFYAGGTFLPSTTLPKQEARKVVKGQGKQEVAPYTWEIAPNGERSIYRQIAGIFGKVISGTFVINCSDTTIAYYGKSRAEVEALADRWNAGERWE